MRQTNNNITIFQGEETEAQDDEGFGRCCIAYNCMGLNHTPGSRILQRGS